MSDEATKDAFEGERAFKSRLRSARELRGLNQGELARKARLPPTSIAHFEGGARKPSFDTLRRLATSLNVTTDYLLGRVDDPDMAAAGDTLFRHVARISDADRGLAEDFLRVLAERNTKRNEGQR